MSTTNPFSLVFYQQTQTWTSTLHNLVEGLLYIPHLQKTFEVTDIQKEEAVLIQDAPTTTQYILTATKIIFLILAGKMLLALFAALVVIDRLCHRFVTKNGEKSITEKIAQGLFKMSVDDIKAKKGVFSQAEKIAKSLLLSNVNQTSCHYLLDFEKSSYRYLSNKPSFAYYLYSNYASFYRAFYVQKPDHSYSYAIFDQQIGKGSGNTLYLGYDLTTEEPVVFREYGSFESANPPSPTFEEERKIHQLLLQSNIPNIVKIHHVSSKTQTNWESSFHLSDYFNDTREGLMLEYCAGGDLLAKIQDKKNPLTIDQKKTIAYELLRTIKHLHELNYIHADLKLANILIKENGEIRVADFGNAGRPLDSNGSPTIIYLAPENIKKTTEFKEEEGFDFKHETGSLNNVCWDNIKKTKENDLWACGVIAFSLFNDEFRLEEKLRFNFFEISSLKACQILSSTIHNIPYKASVWSETNPEDPYVKVIVGLLNPNPKERLSAEKALKLLT